MEIRFTKRSARRHRVGRERARQAMRNATKIVAGGSFEDGEPVYVLLGADDSGRLLEVGVTINDGRVLVVHVMDMRRRFRTMVGEE